MAKFQNIIRTEWLKLKNYLAFWLLLLATAVSYPGINAIVYFGYDESTRSVWRSRFSRVWNDTPDALVSKQQLHLQRCS